MTILQEMIMKNQKVSKEFRPLTAKGIKTMNGLEGFAFEGNIYDGKKKVAYVRDDASGAPITLEWYDKEFEKEYLEYLKSLGTYEEFNHSFTYEPEVMLSNLVFATIQYNDLKRKCPKKIIFQKEGNDSDWFEIKKSVFKNIKDEKTMFDLIRKEENIACILNEEIQRQI